MDFIETLFEDCTGEIEIREIGRNGKARSLFFTKESIKSYEPPEDKNIYFGVLDRWGKEGKTKNCIASKVLWADYDDFKKAEFPNPEKRAEEVKERIRNAGLPNASIIVSSGNGIHAYWLLNKRLSRGIVETNRAIAEATGADIRATDKARVLRLPGTFNNKGPEPLECEILEANDGIEYDISHFKKLDIQYTEKEDKSPLRADSELTRLLYKGDIGRPCISKMLQGVEQGERNFALGRITKYLQYEGYTKSKAKNIVAEWNTKNKPSEDIRKLLNDFEAYWENDYKLLGCSVNNPHIQRMLVGFCDRENCTLQESIGENINKLSVKYNNRLLSEIDRLTGIELAIYGLLLRHEEGLSTSQIMKKAKISRPTVYKRTETLEKLGYIEAIRGPKKSIETLYKAKEQSTYGLGYTTVSNGAISGIINKAISHNAFKVYVMLRKYDYGKGSVGPSLNTLSKELRIDRGNVSKLLKELEKEDYIKRVYRENEKGYVHLECIFYM